MKSRFLLAVKVHDHRIIQHGMMQDKMMQHLNEEEEEDDDNEVPILQDLDLISIGERSDDDDGVVDDITKNNLKNDDNGNGANNNNTSNQHHQQLPRVPVTILTGFLGSGT